MTPYEEKVEIGQELIAAAAKGRAKEVKLLLERGADINAKGVYMETALHWAAARGDESLADLLVDAGAYTTSISRNEQRPEDVAHQFGHDKLASKLQELRVREEWAPSGAIENRSNRGTRDGGPER